MTCRPLMLALVLLSALARPTPAQEPATFSHSLSELVLQSTFEVQRAEQRVGMLRQQLERARKLRDTAGSEQREGPDLEHARGLVAQAEHELGAAEADLQDAVLRRQQAEQLQAMRDGTVVTLDFPGGTMEKYVEAIRKAAGNAPVNIVLAPGLEGGTVPRLSLQRVTVRSALEALAYAESQEGRWTVDEVAAPGQAGAPVYTVNFRPHQAPQAGPQEQRIHVLSIADLIRGEGPSVRPETVLAALETAVGLERTADSTELKFHEDSGLILARGTPRTLSAISEVVETMKRDLRTAREEQRHRQLAAIEARADAQNAEIDLIAAQRQVEIMKKRLEAAEARQQGEGDLDALLAMQAAHAEAQSKLERARVRLEMTQQRLQIQESPAPAPAGPKPTPAPEKAPARPARGGSGGAR